METVVIIVLLLIIWINLHKNIQSASSRIDALTKEIAHLKNLRDADKAPVVTPEKHTVKEKPVASRDYDPYLKVLSVEEKEEEVTVKPKEKQKPEVITAPFAEKVTPAAIISTPPVTKVKKEKKKREPINWEKFIGENLFGKIGILVLVIGIGFFVKYAVDKNYINETVRTILGFVSGGVLLFIAWWLRKRYRTFSSLLSGGAFAIFYVTVAMAYHYYDLFSQPVAFVILVAVTVMMSLLAILYDHRELAIIAIAGGFIAPFLVSTGEGNYMGLFTYILVLVSAMFMVSLYKKWGEIPIISFLLTWIILFVYAMQVPIILMKIDQLANLLIFSSAFYILFLLSIIAMIRINQRVMNLLLLIVITLNNFIFLGFAFWFLYGMELERNYNGIVTILIAAINFLALFWVYRKGVSFRFLYHTLLAVGLLFVSATIPVQLKGTFITIFWASEMVILCWLSTRYKYKILQFFTFLLPFLTFGSLMMDMESAWMAVDHSMLFRNGTFVTAVFTGIAYFLYAWLQTKKGEKNNLAVWATCITLYMAVILDIHLYITSHVLQYSLAGTFTIAVLFGLSVLFHYKKFPFERFQRTYMGWLGFSLFLYFLLSIIVNDAYRPSQPANLFVWISTLLLILHTLFIGSVYYRKESLQAKLSGKTTIYLSILSTLFLLVITYNLLEQLSMSDNLSAGFSVALGIAGFAQMSIGMRLHTKRIRIISLCTFGLVLAKLLIHDLWLLSAAGKVVVFILLGIMFLVLSFLYQKLKAVLFDDE